MNNSLKSTRILETPPDPMIGLGAIRFNIIKLLSNVWTSTHFDESAVTRYAENVMLAETRRGITAMALLSLLIQVAAIALYLKLGVSGGFLYTYGLLALLSVHIVASARFVTDLRALNLLGIILLVATGVAIMAIAHRTGSLNAGLLSSIVLLFMVMPLMPWGLREASIVVGLTYVVFTLSILSVKGRFDVDTLWTVQFLILASATTATLTIIRNTLVRKDDMRARYELEGAHQELKLVSVRDPLTGAWNRRFMEQNFDDLAKRCHEEKQPIRLALLDIDRFKYFNDTYGHHHGDTILQHMTQIFVDSLPSNAFFIRLGGDEFAILSSEEGIEKLVDRCLNHLLTDPILLEQSNGEPVTVSVGLASGPTDKPADLTDLYKQADESLYEAKGMGKQSAVVKQRLIADLARTGSMRISQ